MTKDSLIPYIENNLHWFWEATVNPANSDSNFLQHGLTSTEKVYDYFRAHPNDLYIANTFLSMNYVLKGEYFINHANNYILTNKRLFIWFSDLKKSIPLKNITKYEHAKWDSGVKLEYLENNSQQQISLVNYWLLPHVVNNAINKHKHVQMTNEEVALASELKPTIDATYQIPPDFVENNFIPQPTTSNISSPLNQEYTPQTPKSGNYRAIISLVLFLSLIGGCVYLINKNDTPPSNYVEKKKTKKCHWCGGIGRVGFAGESKAQIERTGMGLGNYCTSCTGTGQVPDDK